MAVKLGEKILRLKKVRMQHMYRKLDCVLLWNSLHFNVYLHPLMLALKTRTALSTRPSINNPVPISKYCYHMCWKFRKLALLSLVGFFECFLLLVTRIWCKVSRNLSNGTSILGEIKFYLSWRLTAVQQQVNKKL